MLVSRPVLLLAVVSSSASQYSQIQQILIKDLKDTLTRRVMIGGENSLELFQAFLVHLAW
jgi:putative NADH-flavin reductase